MHSPNLISSVVLLVMFLTNVATRAAEPKSITLFNGKDLTGWTPYLWNSRERKQDTDKLPSKVWRSGTVRWFVKEDRPATCAPTAN